MKIYAIVILTGALFLVGCGSNQSEDTSSSTMESEAVSIETTAVELANEYDKNTVAADNKFKEKRFKIRGVIAEISTDMFDNAVITMKSGDDFGFNNPQLTLKESEKAEAAGLSAGQNATLICIGAGDVAKTPIADDCIFE